MKTEIYNAYQNACDCLYYGISKGTWNTSGVEDYNVCYEIWQAAKNDLAENNSDRPYYIPSEKTKQILEKLY